MFRMRNLRHPREQRAALGGLAQVTYHPCTYVYVQICTGISSAYNTKADG